MDNVEGGSRDVARKRLGLVSRRDSPPLLPRRQARWSESRGRSERGKGDWLHLREHRPEGPEAVHGVTFQAVDRCSTALSPYDSSLADLQKKWGHF